jgi:putative glutamine amidotransferase
MAALRPPGGTPRIVVTLGIAGRAVEPELAARKQALYLEAVERHGGVAVRMDASLTERARSDAFAAMDGLLLSGGPDVDPARYGMAVEGRTVTAPERDAMEFAALAAAEARAVPVLGICRGLQLMNVAGGGRLVQHVDGHAGPGWGAGPALTHPMRLIPGSRLARILNPTNPGGGVVTVNSHHHQAVRVADLAPGFVAAGLSPSPGGDLVEAFETGSGAFRVGVQCHPERTESTPRAFERLFAFFVDACRGPAARR